MPNVEESIPYVILYPQFDGKENGKNSNISVYSLKLCFEQSKELLVGVK